MFECKDSGARQEFESGMVRDTQEGKPRPDLISPFALLRVGQWMEMGAKKYTERNWEKGAPYSRFVASAMRHLVYWMMGKRDEDHLAAIIFNIQAIIHFEETGMSGLDDTPAYLETEEEPTTCNGCDLEMERADMTEIVEHIPWPERDEGKGHESEEFYRLFEHVRPRPILMVTDGDLDGHG